MREDEPFRVITPEGHGELRWSNEPGTEGFIRLDDGTQRWFSHAEIGREEG